MKSATRKEHTMKIALTSSYLRFVAVLAVALPIAIVCGGGHSWG
jgi:hypothetical protein